MKGREKMSFQENLKYYREKAGYKTAKDFSEALSLPYATYAAYENKNREPKYNTLCKIADLLHVSVDKLLGRNTLPPEKEIISAEEAMKSAENIKRYCDMNCCKCVFVNRKYKMISATAPVNLPPDAVLEYLQNNIEKLEIKEIYSCALGRGRDPQDWELTGCAESTVVIKQEQKL